MGLGFWAKKWVVWPVDGGDGQLFHVEQFEIVNKDEGFDGFWTATRPVGDGGFYGRTDGDLRWDFTVMIILTTSLLVESILG